MNYRDLLEGVRIRVPAGGYSVDGPVSFSMSPSEALPLPLLGAEEGEPTYLASGGRSLILERDRTYRLKGVDPLGAITTAVAESDKTLIADVVKSLQCVPSVQERGVIRAGLVEGSDISIPSYQKKPFGFVTFQNTKNAQRAFDVLGEAYDGRGFISPCQYAGRIAYPAIRWLGSMVYSLLFEIPDAESDLRQTEYERLLLPHLKHASPDELRDVLDDLVAVYHGLVDWHALDCRALADQRLLPQPDSFLGQNHVMGRVGGGLGLTRVDHTSTEHRSDATDATEVREYVSQFAFSLGAVPIMVVQAIEMSERGSEYDRERFSGWFDVAHKFTSEIGEAEAPRYVDAIREIQERFDAAFDAADPQPIPEERVTALVERVRAIEIDREFEERRQARYAALEAHLAERGKSVYDYLRSLT